MSIRLTDEQMLGIALATEANRELDDISLERVIADAQGKAIGEWGMERCNNLSHGFRSESYLGPIRFECPHCQDALCAEFEVKP